jgi:hypothetical protein
MDLKTLTAYNDKDIIIEYLENNKPCHEELDLAFKVAIKNKNINILNVFLLYQSLHENSICCNILLECFMSNDDRIIDLFLSSKNLNTERFYYRYNFMSLLYDIMLEEDWKVTVERKKKEINFFIDEEYFYDQFIAIVLDNNYFMDIRKDIFKFLENCNRYSTVNYLMNTDARINLIYVLTNASFTSRDQKDEKLLNLIRKKYLSAQLKDIKMFEYFPKSKKELYTREKQAFFLAKNQTKNDETRLYDLPNKIVENFLL